MLTTTPRALKSFNPCKPRWKIFSKSLPYKGKGFKDQEVSFVHILEHNGIEDAVWALRVNPIKAVEFSFLLTETLYPDFQKIFPRDILVKEALNRIREWLNALSQSVLPPDCSHISLLTREIYLKYNQFHHWPYTLTEYKADNLANFIHANVNMAIRDTHYWLSLDLDIKQKNLIASRISNHAIDTLNFMKCYTPPEPIFLKVVGCQ